MRLFAAVVPPATVLDDLGDALPGGGALRWTTRESWHLTLAFYGEVADDRVPGLVERLHRVAHRHRPVELRLVGAGQFGGRALWVGCAGEVDALRRIAQSCAAAGRRVGADGGQKRRFRPHLTVARSSRPTDLRELVDALDGYAGPTWTASLVSLFSSHLGAGEGGRPRYELVATADLGG